MLDNIETLLNLAEVSATFAGFAALVTLFARRRLEGGAAHDLMRLRLVIGASVVVVMGALIPVAFAGLGLPEEAIWRSSALIFLVLLCFVIGSFLSSYGTVRGSFPPDKLAVTVAFALEIVVQFSLLTILFGALEERHYGLYISALIGTVGQAAFVFLRLVESSFGNIVDKNDKAASAL